MDKLSEAELVNGFSKNKNNEKAVFNKAEDIFKLVLSIFVIMLHTIPMDLYNVATYAIIHMMQRTAVPFFFTITFYHFWSFYDEQKQLNLFIKKIKRLVTLYLFWQMLYLLIASYDWFYPTYFDFGMSKWYLIHVVLLGQFGILWYVHSVIVGGIASYFLVKLVRKKTIIIAVIIIGAIFLGIFDGWYGVITQHIPYAEKIINYYYNTFVTVRSGFTYGIVFSFVGIILRRESQWFNRWKHRDYLFLSILIILFISEGTLLHIQNSPREYGMFLSSVPLCILGYKFINTHNLMNLKIDSNKIRHTSSLIYFCHMIFIFIFERAFQFLTIYLNPLIFSLVKFFFTLLMSVILSIAIQEIANKPKLIKLIY